MNQITIDGKTYNLVPVEEETEENEELKPTGWERAEYCEGYYSISCGERELCYDLEDNHGLDKSRYEYGNYFTDKQLADDMSRAVGLFLNLNRFAAENQKKKIDWGNVEESKWYFFYDFVSNELVVYETYHYCYVTACFDSRETAQKAIEEFKDELTWYFTEFKNTRRFE